MLPAFTVVRLTGHRGTPLSQVMSVLSSVDLDAAQQWHDTDGIRPWSAFERRRGTDIVSLDDQLARMLLRGGGQMVTRAPMEHLLQGEPGPIIRVAFETPTHWAISRIWHELPDGWVFFGGLLERWNTAGLPALELEEARHLRVPTSIERLENRAFRAGGVTQQGIVGVVRYDLSLKSENHQRQLWALARFGQWRGVGKHTTYGMGRMRILGPKERWQPGDAVAPWDGR